MDNRNTNNLIEGVFWFLLAFLGFYSLGRFVESQRHRELVERIEKLEVAAKDTKEGIDGLYLLHEQRGTNIYTIQDTLVRIFHYTKPHKSQVQFCPECMEHVQARVRDFTEPLDEKDVDPEMGYVPPENRSSDYHYPQ